MRYLDVAQVSSLTGRGEVTANAVCIHEEDTGMLWKHMDWRTGRTEVITARHPPLPLYPLSPYVLLFLLLLLLFLLLPLSPPRGGRCGAGGG